MSVFILALIFTVLFAVTKKVKLMNRGTLVMVLSFVLFIVAVYTTPEEVITDTPEITQMKELDQHIESLDFQNVHMEGETIIVEAHWSKTANSKQEPKDVIEVNNLLEGIGNIMRNQLADQVPSNPIRMLYYKEGKKIGNHLVVP
jgi:Ca2+/Na+ antiporter